MPGLPGILQPKNWQKNKDLKTYIALLRGINVGGHRKIKMADLRRLMNEWGYEHVVTYIQSGNIVFKSNESHIEKIQKKIRMGIRDYCEFDVPVLVKTKEQLATILSESPFKQEEDLKANKIYYTLLFHELEVDHYLELDQKKYPNELFVFGKLCLYLNCTLGAGKAKLTNTIIEKQLKVTATTRNHRTVLKLIELAEET